MRAWAVVHAQLRSYRNLYGSSGERWIKLFLSLIWYGLWTVGAVVAAVVMARVDRGEMAAPLAGLLLLATLYWQFIPLMMAATGVALDIRKLKAYPIPVRELFTMEVLLRVTAAGEVLVVMLGFTAGALWNPKIPWWASLAMVLFVPFQLFLSLGFRDLIVRLVSRRRLRELTTIVILAVVWGPRLFMGNGSGDPRRGLMREFFMRGFADATPWLPWAATGHWLAGTFEWIEFGAMVGWVAAAGAFALWQFKATLAFDPDAAGSSGSVPVKPDAPLTFKERVQRLPSVVLPDPLGVLVEKEIRSQARSSRFRMMLLVSTFFGVVFGRTLFERPLWAPGGLTLACAYGLLAMGEACIWNIFGFDRSAAQVYFVTPVKFGRVLVAKNIAGAVWFVVLLTLLSTIFVLFRFPLTARDVGEAASVCSVVLLFLWSAGNYVSVHSPWPSDPEASMRTRTGRGAQFLVLLLYPLSLAPAALAYFARWAFTSQLAFYGVLAVMGVIAAVVYSVAMESAVGLAAARQEKMVTQLSEGVSPVVS
jgi:ABC-2 type transport system permease protein